MDQTRLPLARMRGGHIPTDLIGSGKLGVTTMCWNTRLPPSYHGSRWGNEFQGKTWEKTGDSRCCPTAKDVFTGR
jgi:hypothetical protein